MLSSTCPPVRPSQHRSDQAGGDNKRAKTAHDNVQSSPTSHSNWPPCPLPLLQPVRHCLHPLLSAREAVRLMRASRSTTACLLSDYHFVDHVLTFDWHTTVAHVTRCLALFARYNMRVLRMCLPRGWNAPLVDSRSGQSLLPSSLIALALGEDNPDDMCGSVVYAGMKARWWAEAETESETDATESETDASEAEYEGGWRGFHSVAQVGGMGCEKESSGGQTVLEEAEREEFRRFQLVVFDLHVNITRWHNQLSYGSSRGDFNQPIPPAALPHGLRYLQFNDDYNQPLQVGSIPNTVQVLHFGARFNQRLEVGHLPASLTHLDLGHDYNRPLLSNVLPAGLRRLYVGVRYNQPLLTCTLPVQLQLLVLGIDYDQPISPGAIPPSVTHVQLSSRYNQPLQPGSIPHGVVHLNLGDSFNQPLLPAVLPTSLRELVISQSYHRALQIGSLPDGLAVLVFAPNGVPYRHKLQPGVVPASVSVVYLGTGDGEELVAGGIPATVRWLRLPRN